MSNKLNKFKFLIAKTLDYISDINNDIAVRSDVLLKPFSYDFYTNEFFIKEIELAIKVQNFDKLREMSVNYKKIRPYFNDVDRIYFSDANKILDYKKIINNEIPEKKLNESVSYFFGGDERESLRFLRKEHIETFLKYINVESFFHTDKVKYLKKMYEDSAFLIKMLLPLKELGVSYTVDLTGGCVRDFVLNKAEHIKDLDVMVSMTFPYTITKDMLFKAGFTKDELNVVNWNDNENNSLKKENLILLCVNRHNINKEVFSIKNRFKTALKFQSDYGTTQTGRTKEVTRQDRLISVIKIDKGENNYPLDILLTDFSKPEFLRDFDFNICKASICIKNDHMGLDLPDHYSELISRFNALIDFWFDVYYKKITYDTLDRGEYHINTSFGKPENLATKKSHFRRIKEKYPDYDLLISHDKNLTLSNDNAKNLKVMIEKVTLDELLTKKEEQKSKKVFKI